MIQHGSAPAARQYAKWGCPAGLRGEVWKIILGLEVDDMVSNRNHNTERLLIRKEFPVM